MTDHGLIDAATQAVEKLTDAWACVHGPEFDSNEQWGNDCSVCDAMRPLVLAIAHRAAQGGAAGTGGGGA